MEDEASNRSFQSSKEEYHRKGRHRKSHLHDHFRPSVWGWRKPAEEDAIMPNGAWIYLALIGFLTFMIAHSVNSVSQFISTYCISNLANYSASKYGTTPALVTLAALRGLSLAISFLIIWKIAPTYTAGSGIPEMKCVLSGVLMQRMLNWETLMAKMLGLIFSLASSISIGRLGPFIHMSSITAALVSRSSWFPSLRGSARFQLQALSAAMAAGVGATFGAPIGGTMLSIEVMSTYYYIHWLPMALYCSIMGYYFLITVVQPNNEAFFSSSIKVDFQVESVRRLLTYVVLGALCGMIGAAFVQFTMWAFQIRSRHFKTSTPVRTTVMVVIFAAMHTVISSLSTNVLALEQKEGVVELINSMGGNGPSWVQGTWKPFRFEEWNTCLSLLFAMAVKFVLSGLSLIMPVPAGTFMPIFQIGALFGRAFGELLSSFSFVNWVDPRATAIIGAASVVSGALHTTSIAVVMLELTREAIDILPLTVGVIVSYGVSKLLCSDLFSELIKIRKLPFILGLRERYPSENKQFLDDISSVVAGTFMWKDFPFVTPQSTRGDVYKMLTKGGRPWISCAFLSNSEDRRLWGTISQQTMWEAIGEDFNATSGDTVGGSVMYGSFGEDADRISRDNELVPLLRDFDPDVGHALVDMGPMQVSRSTPFWKIVTLFRMLSMNTMYVMKDGMTVGSVNRAQLIQYSYHLEARAKRKRQQEREEQQRIKRQQEEVIGNIQRFSARTNRLASRPSPTDIDVSMAMAGRRGSRHGSRHSSRQGSFSNVRGSNW